MNPTLLLLVGVSGSGKTTVLSHLLDNFPQLDLIKSRTTRDLRPGETPGEKYNFSSLADFKKSESAGDFLETAQNHQSARYGTKKSDIESSFSRGKIPIKEIDIQGLEILRTKKEISHRNITAIFLDIDDATIRTRILHRDPTTPEDEIQRRIASAQRERQKAQKLCDFIIDATQPVDTVKSAVATKISETLLKNSPETQKSLKKFKKIIRSTLAIFITANLAIFGRFRHRQIEKFRVPDRVIIRSASALDNAPARLQKIHDRQNFPVEFEPDADRALVFHEPRPNSAKDTNLHLTRAQKKSDQEKKPSEKILGSLTRIHPNFHSGSLPTLDTIDCRSLARTCLGIVPTALAPLPSRSSQFSRTMNQILPLPSLRRTDLATASYPLAQQRNFFRDAPRVAAIGTFFHTGDEISIPELSAPLADRGRSQSEDGTRSIFANGTRRILARSTGQNFTTLTLNIDEEIPAPDKKLRTRSTTVLRTQRNLLDERTPFSTQLRQLLGTTTPGTLDLSATTEPITSSESQISLTAQFSSD